MNEKSMICTFGQPGLEISMWLSDSNCRIDKNLSALRMQILQDSREEMQILQGLSLSQFAFLRKNFAIFAL